MLLLAWGSRSMRSVLLPRSASAAARLTAVVVLPTPPFWFAIARIIGLRHPWAMPDPRREPSGDILGVATDRRRRTAQVAADDFQQTATRKLAATNVRDTSRNVGRPTISLATLSARLVRRSPRTIYGLLCRRWPPTTRAVLESHDATTAIAAPRGSHPAKQVIRFTEPLRRPARAGGTGERPGGGPADIRVGRGRTRRDGDRSGWLSSQWTDGRPTPGRRPDAFAACCRPRGSDRRPGP